MDLNFSGASAINVVILSVTEPSPIAIKPDTGIMNPPIQSPIALTVAGTATAFKPPKMAYMDPITPIPHTHTQVQTTGETPGGAGTLNISQVAMPPEYTTTGK